MKITRLIAFVLVAAMLLPWVVVPDSHAHVHAHETEPTLTVGAAEGYPGDTLQIPVMISNNPGITVLNTRVQFDDAAVEVVNSRNNPSGPLSGCTFMKSQKDGTNPVTMYWESGLENYTDNGVIGFIEVKIKADAQPGTYDVVIEVVPDGCYNIEWEEVKFDLVAGSVKVFCAAHDFTDYVSDGNATCTADGTKSRECKLCGEIETVADAGSALGHSFTVYVADNNADCENDGTETAKCDRCDATDTRAVDGSKLGHSFTVYVSNGDATCEADGTETAKCDRCDATDVRTAVGSALGHSFTEYVSDNNATCETDGTETATCDRCGVTDTRTDVGSREDAEHSFPAEYTSDGNATCTADGTKSRVCQVCGEKETVTDVGSKLGHSFTNYVSDDNATCLNDGTETAKCDRCDATDTRTVAGSALGHSFTNYVSNGDATCEADGTETAKCDRCDTTDTRTDADSKLGHSYTAQTTEYQATAADCCHKATYYYTCVRCGEKGTETFESGAFDMTNHVGGTEVRGTVAPTEEAEGYTGDTYCLGCETVIAKGEVIPALGHTHTMVKTEAEEATCETAGNTAYWTCSKCGKLYADDKGVKEITAEDTVIAALGHSFTSYVSDNNATCLIDGTETAKCDRCDVTDTRTVEGSKLGHSFTSYVSDNNATCETDGTETAKCDRCDATDTRTDSGSALGHSYTAQTTEYQATAADCCHKATYYYTCVRCGEKGTETFEHGDVDLTNHVGGTELRGAVEPTEEKEGYTGDTYCLGCETVIAKGQTIPVLDHTHVLVKTDAKEATCETAGNTAYWTCSKCGKLYADDKGIKEITAEDTVTAALGHSFVEYVSDNNATCEADGTETAKCSRCDVTDTRTAVGSALGHAWSEWTVTTAPTCAESGEEERVCGNCGKTETNALEALGHSFTAYVSDDNATCEADGTETAKCSRCDVTDTRTAVGSALGHAWSEWTVTTAPTCAENGEEERVCGNCGKTETNALEALGHSFTAYVSDDNATCEEDGTETAKCDRCDATDTRTAVGSALGHAWSEWTVTTAPTCTENGEEERVCGSCGKTETNALEALGHDFGEWTVTTAATCTETGEQVRVCGVCGETEKQEIAALGHDYKSVVTEPTETEKGYTTHTCAVCGDSYVDTYVDPVKPEDPDLDKQPQTGDSAQITLWTVLTLVSVLGAGVLTTGRKKWLA